MTEAAKEPRRALAELLSRVVANDIDDMAINGQLGVFERLDDKLVLAACHRARHFIADRDLHARDDEYRSKRLSELQDAIASLLE